jgi:SDR family mycofactocin-dependent oxidoreductase
MGNRVEGKVAFVTGAARGQGRSHAVRLAEEGADIIAVDICGDIEGIQYPLGTSDELNETVSMIEALDRRVVARQADVRDFGALKGALDDGVAELGKLDVVVANAGLVDQGPKTWELSEESYQVQTDVLLKGVWNTYRATVPRLIEQGNGGSIIATGSMVAIKAQPQISIYAAAKAGVTVMSDSLANEVAQYGIRVNTVHPTNTNTDLIWKNDGLLELFTPDLGRLPTKEEFAVPASGANLLWDPQANWQHPIPWVDPVDISNAILFLASDESRYVTGLRLKVDLGALVKA